MRAGLKSWWLLGLLSILGWLGGCDITPSERPGYAIGVEIDGTMSAWRNVDRVEVNHQPVDYLPPTIPDASTADGGLSETFVTSAGLCTSDRARFLSGRTVEIRVWKNSRIVTSSVERVACRFSENPGTFEYMVVELQQDGSILADFENGSPTGIRTFCTGDGNICPADTY